MRLTGKGTDKLILALMIAAAFLSTIMSNVPVSAMMMSISMGILRATNAQPGKSRLGRTLMIGIPVAAMCGGIVTPGRSSLNVLAIGLFNAATGETVTFFDWMMVGVPLCVVAASSLLACARSYV